MRQQQGGTRPDGHLLIEGGQADFLGRMEEEAARLRQAAEIGGGFRHLGQFQINGLGGELRGRHDPLRTQQHDLCVVVEQAKVDARKQEGHRQRRPSRQRGTQFGFDLRAGQHFGPGQVERHAGPRRRQDLLDAVIELVALGSPPLQPPPSLLAGGEKGCADGETLGGKQALTPCPSPRGRGEQSAVSPCPAPCLAPCSPAPALPAPCSLLPAGPCSPLPASAPRSIRHLHAGVVLEAGDRGIVHAPVGTGKLGVAVGRKPQGQAAEAGVAGVALDQFPHGGEHRLLDPRIERVVVRRQAAAGGIGLAPGGAVGADPLQALGLGAAAAADRLQGRQRRGKLDRRDQLQMLPVHQPQQHLQHVLRHRVLAAGEEHARVVARRRLQDLAGIDRAAVGGHGEDQAVVAGVTQVIDQPRTRLVEGLPVLQRPPAPGVERFVRREVFRQQRAVHVGRHQPRRAVEHH